MSLENLLEGLAASLALPPLVAGTLESNDKTNSAHDALAARNG